MGPKTSVTKTADGTLSFGNGNTEQFVAPVVLQPDNTSTSCMAEVPLQMIPANDTKLSAGNSTKPFAADKEDLQSKIEMNRDRPYHSWHSTFDCISPLTRLVHFDSTKDGQQASMLRWVAWKIDSLLGWC